MPDTSNAYALVFNRDEAFSILKQCASIREHPAQPARKILGGHFIPPFRRATTLAASKISSLEGPIRLILQALFLKFHQRVASEGYRFAESPFVAACATLGFAILLILVAWTINHFFPRSFYKDQSTFVKVCCNLAIVYQIYRLIDLLFGWLHWASILILRLSLVVGIRVAADAGLGNDIGFAMFQSIERKPRNGNVKVIEFPPDIEDEVVTQAYDSAREIARKLYDVLAEHQLELLVSNVTKVLSDATLVHAQYYQHLRAISLIAKCIADRPPEHGRVTPSAPDL